MAEEVYKGFLIRPRWSSGLDGFDAAWVEVVHTSCGRTVFGHDDDDCCITLAELLFIVQAHRCPE